MYLYKMEVSGESEIHVINIEESNETCIFCLEPVPSNKKSRPCLCVIHYHEYCYLTWVASYDTTCPLCRKTPVAIINKDTMELEFELVENGHQSSSTPRIEEYGTTDNIRNYTNKHIAIMCAIVFGAIAMVVLMILIFLRIYNI
jgi:hypothetical protein